MMFLLAVIKHRFYWCAIIILSFGSLSSNAQRTRIEDAFVWYSQSVTVPIGTKWAIQEDGSVRWYGLNRNVSFLTLRVGLEYKLTKSLSVTAGYTFFDQFKDRGGFYENRAEHRPWQQALLRRSWSIYTMVHRFRVEERFFSEPLPEGRRNNYHFYRLRYMASIQVSPFKKGILKKGYFIAQAEVMFHAGDNHNVIQSFDQYRLYPHIGYKVTPKLDLQTGYMYYYQINPANTQETIGHTLRFSIFYVFSKKQKAEPNK
ncbi:MAG: hypothetical protein K0R51_3504 [Cytophagaceae bacterium]|jgi:hypothetical protein|nr:hypothetical protein [Cytophagaceae bacterium]